MLDGREDIGSSKQGAYEKEGYPLRGMDLFLQSHGGGDVDTRCEGRGVAIAAARSNG